LFLFFLFQKVITRGALSPRPAATADPHARLCTGLADYQRYYLTSAAFAEAHSEVLQSVFSELGKAGQWLRANPREADEQLGPLGGNLVPQMSSRPTRAAAMTCVRCSAKA